MTIGAVVVSHNSAEDLPACLEALQDAEALEMVVVVDNASQDQSRELADHSVSAPPSLATNLTSRDIRLTAPCVS